MTDLSLAQGSKTSPAPLVRVRGISERFGGVEALRGVDFEMLPGEVHALVGDNRAGKSTLIKILSGVQDYDEGLIELGGEQVRFTSPAQSRKAGIAVVYQDLSLVELLSVAENLLLGREPRTAFITGLLAHSIDAGCTGRAIDAVGGDCVAGQQVEPATLGFDGGGDIEAFTPAGVSPLPGSLTSRSSATRPIRSASPSSPATERRIAVSRLSSCWFR